MSAIDDARYICQEIGSVRDAITDMTTMLVSALTNQDLAAQLKALEERFKVLSDCYESHLVALHPAKQSIRFGPVLNDAKPAVDREPRTCRDCKRYDSGLCLKHNRRVSSEAHICNDFGPAKDTEDAVELPSLRGMTLGEIIDQYGDDITIKAILRQFAAEVARRCSDERPD